MQMLSCSDWRWCVAVRSRGDTRGPAPHRTPPRPRPATSIERARPPSRTSLLPPYAHPPMNWDSKSLASRIAELVTRRQQRQVRPRRCVRAGAEIFQYISWTTAALLTILINWYRVELIHEEYTRFLYRIDALLPHCKQCYVWFPETFLV